MNRAELRKKRAALDDAFRADTGCTVRAAGPQAVEQWLRGRPSDCPHKQVALELGLLEQPAGAISIDSDVKPVVADGELDGIADEIHASLSQADGAREQWIGAMTRVAIAAARARRCFKDNVDFGAWWDSQAFTIAGKRVSHQDRAALVQIGADKAAAAKTFETTARTSLRLIASEDLPPVREELDLPPVKKRHSGAAAQPQEAVQQEPIQQEQEPVEQEQEPVQQVQVPQKYMKAITDAAMAAADVLCAGYAEGLRGYVEGLRNRIEVQRKHIGALGKIRRGSRMFTKAEVRMMLAHIPSSGETRVLFEKIRDNRDALCIDTGTAPAIPALEEVRAGHDEYEAKTAEANAKAGQRALRKNARDAIKRHFAWR